MSNISTNVVFPLQFLDSIHTSMHSDAYSTVALAIAIVIIGYCTVATDSYLTEII